MNTKPNKLIASSVEPRTKSVYPEPFASMMNRREKRALGDFFGIQKFGVNLTTIKPGGQSSLMHRHSKSEEFIYVLKGEITLITEAGETVLTAGECAGFIPTGSAHMLMNKSHEDVEYLEIGDREKGDEADYPQDDIKASQNELGKWIFHHKDGSPY
jgi:uncharacterized cupin superfamily protein